MRTIPMLASGDSRTFSFAIGPQKLGRAVPESNSVAESNKAVSQQMQRDTPMAWLFGFSFVYGRSVPAWRVTSKETGVSSFFHSSSDLLMGLADFFDLRSQHR